MTKGTLINNTKTRRKGSMLQDSLSKIKYLVLLAFLLVIPIKAKAGFITEPIDQTDTGANRLIYYFDDHGRHTYIQLTNTSDEEVCVHIQIFAANDPSIDCREQDAEECLSAGDTNVYDMENLPFGLDYTDQFGFVAVSIESGPSFSLIGMFRILDDNGYEYRSNAADSTGDNSFEEAFNILNFNDVTGNSNSDVVGISYIETGPSQVFASPFIGTVFGSSGSQSDQNFILNSSENAVSCSPVGFYCDSFEFSRGIDNSLPSTHGFDPICATSVLSTDTAGWLFLPYDHSDCFDDNCGESTEVFFVGFLGLNNGDGTGSMDSWMSSSIGFVEAVAPASN
jgi:hypothetical protein